MDEIVLEKERKIVRLHLIYGLIILAILSVGLLVLIPGHINQSAFDNFCFAATIVSIVLAVVSIVYSFRTKNNASDNMAGIREVERGISEKLLMFDEIEKHILAGLEKGINPIQQDVNTLHDDQVGIRESIEQLKEEMRLQTAIRDEHLRGKAQNSNAVKFATNSFLGNIALYIACLSSKTHKAINLGSINKKLEQRRDYLFGYLIALAVTFPEKISAKNEVGKTIIASEFTVFDVDTFGDEIVCKQRVESYSDKNLVKEYIDSIDRYFSSNQ